jgi:hypothetical protein
VSRTKQRLVTRKDIFAKDYICQHISIPHKKKKKMALTEQQKSENKWLASERISVEA